MFDKTYIGRDVLGTFAEAQQLQSWSRVTIQVDEDTAYTAGTDTGRTLTVVNPWGTQKMAEEMLSRLRGRSYQPYTAEKSLPPRGAWIEIFLPARLCRAVLVAPPTGSVD